MIKKPVWESATINPWTLLVGQVEQCVCLLPRLMKESEHWPCCCYHSHFLFEVRGTWEAYDLSCLNKQEQGAGFESRVHGLSIIFFLPKTFVFYKWSLQMVFRQCNLVKTTWATDFFFKFFSIAPCPVILVFWFPWAILSQFRRQKHFPSCEHTIGVRWIPYQHIWVMKFVINIH